MPTPINLMIVAGARPNFMKVAPLIRAIFKKREEYGQSLRTSLVHTGQHYDPNMSEIFFRELGIPAPDHYLGVGSGSHAEQTARIMVGFEKLLIGKRPNWVVVVGDVNSTIACSLTAKKMGLPVAHVEAGLRSFDMGMPEEINRKLTDAISDLLFVTEEAGRENLLREGVPGDRIYFVGNVMIDTMIYELEQILLEGFQPQPEVARFLEGNPRYGVMTLHRPSNVDDPKALQPLWHTLLMIGEEIPLIFPIHPRTRVKLEEFSLSPGRITLVEPIGYRDMLYLMKNARVVLTDSGGIQEETTALKIPCVTLRNNTERPVTVEIGSNFLAGTDPVSILSTTQAILGGKVKKGRVPPLWDGHAAERIIEIILDRNLKALI